MGLEEVVKQWEGIERGGAGMVGLHACMVGLEERSIEEGRARKGEGGRERGNDRGVYVWVIWGIDT